MSDSHPEAVFFPIEEIGGDEYVDVSEYYETHRRRKNYVAEITGEDAKFKWKREFIKFVYFDGTAYVPLSAFKPGYPYEFAFIYYSGSGNRYPRLKGFYVFEGVNDDPEDGKVAVFAKVGERWLKDFFSTVREINPMEELRAKIAALMDEYGAEEVMQAVEDVLRGL